jgi:orotate phosphoribosyltransferase
MCLPFFHSAVPGLQAVYVQPAFHRGEAFYVEKPAFVAGQGGEAERSCPVPGSTHSVCDTNGTRLNSLVILSAVTPSSVLDLFSKTGAYLLGHFRLTSGLHSGEYLQCAKVLAFPDYAEFLGSALAQRLQAAFPNLQPAVVVSPAIGGIVIGHEVGRALGVRALFTERDGTTRQMALRRGFEIRKGERAIVIEDVITTGGSTREVIELLQSLGAEVVAAGSIIDRSGGGAEVGVRRTALETLRPVSYAPDDCPLCRQNIPIVKPGSRPT